MPSVLEQKVDKFYQKCIGLESFMPNPIHLAQVVTNTVSIYNYSCLTLIRLICLPVWIIIAVESNKVSDMHSASEPSSDTALVYMTHCVPIFFKNPIGIDQF